jgi:hypothetical protein
MKKQMLSYIRNKTLVTVLAGSLAALSASAHERYFTYTYEPETMPQGGWEFEQWVTSRLTRNANVGQQGFQKWEFRSSAEYGVTDNYTVELYVNNSLESFRDPLDGSTTDYKFDGISVENRYMVLNPTEHPIGLTLYVEPRFSGVEFEMEEKVIIGQRHGNWKWAVNLTHATEWADHFNETEGEVEFTAGIAREIGKHWAVGLELRDHNEVPEYKDWENTAVSIGPVVSYHRANWWATLTVLPQIYGANFMDNPDGISNLDLEGHERVDVRLIFGIQF